MSDFEIAVQRLTDWLKKHQDDMRAREFIGDITLVLLAAKESARHAEENAQLKAKLEAAEARKEQDACLYIKAMNTIVDLEARLRKYEPEPDCCEHGVREGDWCEPCNREYKEAAKAGEDHV